MESFPMSSFLSHGFCQCCLTIQNHGYELLAWFIFIYSSRRWPHSSFLIFHNLKCNSGSNLVDSYYSHKRNTADSVACEDDIFSIPTEPATGHHLNQWLAGLLTHICVTRPLWKKNTKKQQLQHENIFSGFSFVTFSDVSSMMIYKCLLRWWLRIITVT